MEINSPHSFPKEKYKVVFTRIHNSLCHLSVKNAINTLSVQHVTACIAPFRTVKKPQENLKTAYTVTEFKIITSIKKLKSSN